MAVLAFAEALVYSRQVIFDGGHRHHPARAGHLAGGADQLEVVLERAIPAPALPGHRPALEPRCRADGLDLHPGLVNGPRVHRADAGRVLRDHRLQHRERETGRTVVLQLLLVQRELARALADRMREGDAEIARGEIDAVRLPDVVGEVARESAAEALEVTGELRAHPLRPVPRSPAPARAASDPRDRRTPPEGSRPRPPPPRACGG